MRSKPLVKIESVVKRFPIKTRMFGRPKEFVHAVRGVSLAIGAGETVGLVGESGCGKSTLGMLLLRLFDVDEGRIFFEGIDLTQLKQKELKPFRREMQVVFQDPYASLNPRMVVGDIIEEPLIVHRLGAKQERQQRVSELLDLVGLSQGDSEKYPHEFSGGQRQRIGIARALALQPKLIIADEPVSALDVSIRGEILNLMLSLQERFGLAYLFISHDLHVVRYVSHRIAVMYLGKMMELFPAAEAGEARHPYTEALISAVPIPDPQKKQVRKPLKGDVPSPIAPPSGCPFHPRCPYAKPICSEKEPAFEEYRPGFFAACHVIHEMKPIGGVYGETMLA